MSQLERFQSGLKLSSHREWVTRYLETGSNYPITLEIDPTNRCPLHCEYCIWGDYRENTRASLPADVMLRIVDEAASLGVKSIIWTGGGEPLSNHGTIPAILRSHDLGIKNALFSNGVPLSPQLSDILLGVLTWARFHIDGATAATYSKVHHVPESVFQKVVDNISYLAKRKKDTDSMVSIGIGSVALPNNLPEVSDLAILAKNLGLDYFQYKHDLTQMSNQEYLIWWNEKVVPLLRKIGLELEDSTFKLQFSQGASYDEPDLSPKCHVHHMNTAITADGRVAYCKSLRDNIEWSLGNVMDSSLQSIFDSDRHKRLIQEVTPTTCGVIPCPYKSANVLIQHMSRTGDLGILVNVDENDEHSVFI